MSIHPTPMIDKRYQKEVTLVAQDLSARMIGSIITFAWRMEPMKVRVQVIGELRQLSVRGGTVSVLVSSHDQDGGGSLAEFEVDFDHEITFVEVKP